MSKMKDYLSQISVDIGKCGVIYGEVMMVALNREAAEDSVAEFYAQRCEQFDVVYPFDMRVDELIAIGFEDSCYRNDGNPSLILETAGYRMQVWYGFTMEDLTLYTNQSYVVAVGTEPDLRSTYREFTYFDELIEFIESYQQKHGGLDD